MRLRSLIGGFEPVVLSSVMGELEGLSHNKGRDGAAARCGLALGKECTIADSRDLESESVDAQVIEYAAQNGCIVVTNDRRYTGCIVHTRDRCNFNEKTEETGIIAEVERKCITN